MNRRLYRSVHERVLGGVGRGVEKKFDLDPSLVRVGWAILILASVGGFLLLYIVMWIVVPEAPLDGFAAGSWTAPPPGPPSAPAPSGSHSPASGEASAGGSGSPESGAAPGHESYGWSDHRYRHRHSHRSGSGGLVIGALLVIVGGWFLLRDTFGWIRLPELWPLLVIGVGLLLLYGAFRPGSD